MLGWIRATRRTAIGAGLFAIRLDPTANSNVTSKAGTRISPANARRRDGALISSTSELANPNENQTMRNETPDTPVHSATWINGAIRNWDVPRRFQGKPLRKRLWTISNATQRAARPRPHRCRRPHELSAIASNNEAESPRIHRHPSHVHSAV